MNANSPDLAGLRLSEEDSLPTRRSLMSRLRNLEDGVSWSTFFDSYWRLIYNVARKSGLDDSDAQDVVQETVIAVARRMPEFRYDPAKGSFKQWLLLITRRRIHDHLRRLYRSHSSQSALVALVEAQRQGAPVLTPDAELEAAYEREWQHQFLQAALAQLRQRASPKHFQVLDFCVLQDMPAAKVARMLGMSAAQVYLAKHRMTRAVKRLVAELEAKAAASTMPGSQRPG